MVLVPLPQPLRSRTHGIWFLRAAALGASIFLCRLFRHREKRGEALDRRERVDREPSREWESSVCTLRVDAELSARVRDRYGCATSLQPQRVRNAHPLFCVGADWLQGPYAYSLYKDQYGFSERMVALFFVAGFLSAGIAAPMVGAWADQQYVFLYPIISLITYSKTHSQRPSKTMSHLLYHSHHFLHMHFDTICTYPRHRSLIRRIFYLNSLLCL